MARKLDNKANDLCVLEKKIESDEKSIQGIKPGCEAKIIWADSTKKTKTELAFLYIHGFCGSHIQAHPIHRSIAQKYAANLFLARLAGHGIDLGNSTMERITADDFARSAKQALLIAKSLGDNVIIISNSFGGALSCWLASEHPEIKGLVLYSPCIRTHEKNSEMLAKPGGVQLVIKFRGSAIMDFQACNGEYSRYWTARYHLNGSAAFQTFLFTKMNKETFEQIKCPVFMGYWYKSENEKDTIASVPAMLKMFDELASENKQKFAFSEVGNHDLSTPICSKDIETVQRETEKFLEGIL